MRVFSIYIAAVLIQISITTVVYGQNTVVVVPMFGDSTNENPAIVYTGVAPIEIVTNEPATTGTVSFNVATMPVLPTNKLPNIDLHQPSLGINCVIALVGTFPSRNGADPYIGDIMYVGFNFAPRGWAFCSGQLLPINSNQSLYSLLGTIYGGDGRTTFALPDLRGRVPVHAAGGQGTGLPNWSIGQKFGRTSE